MSAQRIIGPTLADLCPAFKAKLAEYARLADTDPQAAQIAFMEAQAIAREFRAQEAR